MIETKFKNTELGLIPADWENGTFSDFIDYFSAGATPYRGNPSNFVGSIPWISSGELNYNRITDTREHISEDGRRSAHLTLHQKGTFLIAITGLEASGTRGRCAFVETPATTNQSCLAMRSTQKLSVEYLFWFYRIWSDYLAFNFSQGSKQQSFTADIVRKLPLYAPSPDEQIKIAEALTDVDSLISELSALIEKKQSVLKGSMQELLTARRRLPGFTEPWILKRFSEIGSTYNGITGKSATDFGHGNAHFVTFINVIYNTCISRTAFEKVDIAPSERQNKVLKDDLLFNTSSETPEEVGMCAFVPFDEPNLFLNSFCFGFRPTDREIDSCFLAYLVRSKAGRALMLELAQGSTRYNLPKKKLLSSSILLPKTRKEQQAIAEILSDMDAEIVELEAKRDKYIALRQGMMQQLLTGKIRLI